jgi:hypothetical protein
MKGKTVSCSATTFLNFCVFLNAGFFFTLFVQKACVSIKDHLKVNASNIFSLMKVFFLQVPLSKYKYRSPSDTFLFIHEASFKIHTPFTGTFFSVNCY